MFSQEADFPDVEHMPKVVEDSVHTPPEHQVARFYEEIRLTVLEQNSVMQSDVLTARILMHDVLVHVFSQSTLSGDLFPFLQYKYTDSAVSISQPIDPLPNRSRIQTFN